MCTQEIIPRQYLESMYCILGKEYPPSLYMQNTTVDNTHSNGLKWKSKCLWQYIGLGYDGKGKYFGGK